MKVRYYCTCGAAFSANATGQRRLILKMLATFMSAHRELDHKGMRRRDGRTAPEEGG